MLKGPMMKRLLRVDRPGRIWFDVNADLWKWNCLCAPEVWPQMGKEAHWDGALAAMVKHLRDEHPHGAVVIPAPALAETAATPAMGVAA